MSAADKFRVSDSPDQAMLRAFSLPIRLFEGEVSPQVKGPQWVVSGYPPRRIKVRGLRRNRSFDRSEGSVSNISPVSRRQIWQDREYVSVFGALAEGRP